MRVAVHRAVLIAAVGALFGACAQIGGLDDITLFDPSNDGAIAGAAGESGVGGFADGPQLEAGAPDANDDGSAGNAGNGGAGNGGSGANAGGGGVAGSSGQGGMGGNMACGDAGTCGPLEECGSAGTRPLCVAMQVLIPAPMGDPYFMDATEVSASQYKAWLLTIPSPSTLPSYCKSISDGGVWKTAFNIGGGIGNHPAVDVDWCDAHGYCKGVGKRLCGKIGGGSTDPSTGYNDATVDQWYNACTSGGVDIYPYGNTYQGQTCNGADYSSAVATVGSMTGCESPVQGYGGVYDLSGNVWEWEDSCDGNAGSSDKCRIRGGSFLYDSSGGGLRCDDAASYSRNVMGGDVGFRCCAL
jgi:formylglycine-generating enzyme